MPFQLIEEDITTIEVDVIVNAANEELREGGGVCGAIFKEAGSTQLQEACEKIGHCKIGEAVMTDGFGLPAKKIIHTVGPIWQGGTANEAELLTNAYRNSLKLAYDNGYETIAFPLISSGIFGYPREAALQIAVSTIIEFLTTHEMTVYLTIYNKNELFKTRYDYHSLDAFLRATFEEREKMRGELLHSRVQETNVYQSFSLESIIDDLEMSFSESLFVLINEKGMTDVETYKKANIDRRLFSKIRSNPNYAPSKKTVVAFAIALQLTLDETLSLLEKAGYTLSKSNRFDLIIRYFIAEKKYDVFEINEALFAYDEELLGA